jgi:hypothetical protein
MEKLADPDPAEVLCYKPQQHVGTDRQRAVATTDGEPVTGHGVLRDDPQERRGLTAQGPRWAGLMTSRLQQLRSANQRSLAAPQVVLDGEIRHQLRALGYLR